MQIAFLAPSAPIHQQLFELLQARLPDHTLTYWTQDQPAPSNDFEVLLSMGPVTRELLSGQTRLTLVQTLTAGYETVDLEAATELGILVSYAPSDKTRNAESVAEHAIFLMLAAANRLNTLLQTMKLSQPRPALLGKQVCVLGLGAIGSRIAGRLTPWGVKLSAVDRSPEKARGQLPTRPLDELGEAVAEADFLVVSLAASPETEKIVNAELLSKARPGLVLVNVGRGSLVDEEALLQALDSGQVGAAGLDVLADESSPRGPFAGHPQVFITPHVAGATDVTQAGTVDFIVANLQRYAEGRPLRTLLNRPAPSTTRSTLAD